MKLLTYSIMLTSVLSILMPACTEKPKGRVVEDTVIGHWTVKTAIDTNNIVVGQDDWAVNDSSVFATVSYGKKKLCSDLEIRTSDLTGIEGEYMMAWGGEIFWASDSALYLSFGCFIPDSDVGWKMLYQITENGESNIITLLDEMGVEGFDVVADFMALYLNEKAVGSSSESLRQLFYKYCTESVSEALYNGNISIAPDSTDFRYAESTMSIESQDEMTDNIPEAYSFIVEFGISPDKERLTEKLLLKVDASSYKISRIEKLQHF